MEFDRAGIIAEVCGLVTKNRNAAIRKLRSEYPFVGKPTERKSKSVKAMMPIFKRDGFVDRYTGKRVVNTGALRMLGLLLPEDFPWDSHSNSAKGHPALWHLRVSVDHLKPLAFGGLDEPSNLVTTSMGRNMQKGNRTLEELGWQLHPPGRLQDWDGLSSWFVARVEEDRSVLKKVPMIRDWFQATKKAEPSPPLGTDLLG